MRVLILVDVQNDFCPGGSLPVKEGDQIVPVINRLQGTFDLVVATKDWHPKDHSSFAVNHGKNPGEVVTLPGGIEQVLWPAHCIQDSIGAEFVPGLEMGKVAKVVYKGVDQSIDSYSGFFDNGRRRSTGLEPFLRERGVEEVFVVGLATDYCVKWTALDAASLGFKTTVVVDACRGVDLKAGDTERALEELRKAGVSLRDGAEVLAGPAREGRR